MTKLSTLKQCRRGNHLKSYAFLNFFYQHLQITDPFWVSFFFKFKTETILPLIVKIPTKISALPKKKINHRQQMYDSSKHSCHSIARPRSSSKLAGVPTQMFIVLHAGYKKKYTSVTKHSDKKKTMATYCCPNNPLNLLPSYVCTDM